jgi:hypothetical protein
MTDKERLEEIKNSYLEGLHRLFGASWVSMPKENFDWLIQQAERVQELEQVIGDLDENVAAFETLWIEEKRKNQRYKQALEYIQRAIYTQHCTKNHKWNSEFEKGQISGLIQASNIVDKAIRKVEGEV